MAELQKQAEKPREDDNERQCCEKNCVSPIFFAALLSSLRIQSKNLTFN